MKWISDFYDTLKDQRIRISIAIWWQVDANMLSIPNGPFVRMQRYSTFVWKAVQVLNVRTVSMWSVFRSPWIGCSYQTPAAHVAMSLCRSCVTTYDS